MVTPGQKIHVKRFGAVGDGVTDDTVAIQKANDSCEKFGLSLEFNPHKTYVISKVDAKCKWLGFNTRLLQKAATDSFALHINTEKPSFENFVFDGNKANQAEPTFSENYQGFAKNSFIQAFRGFKEGSFSGSVFKNMAFGAIAFTFDSEDPGVALAYPNVDTDYAFADRTIEKLKLNNCHFENCATEAIRVSNRKINLAAAPLLQLPGGVFIENCTTYKVGTDKLVGTRYQQGDTIIAGNFGKFRVTNCEFEESARFDIKLGIINDVKISKVNSKNPAWGTFQIQTNPFDGLAYDLKGTISLDDVALQFDKIWSNNTVPLLAQLKGSLSADVNHTFYENASVTNCKYHNFTGSTTVGLDAIQLTEQTKIKNFVAENVTGMNVRRSLIGISRPAVDGWNMESAIIKGCPQVIGQTSLSTSALVRLQGVGGFINNLTIIDNKVEGFEYGAYSLTVDGVKNLTVENNNIKNPTLRGGSAADITSLVTSIFRNNYSDKHFSGITDFTVYQHNPLGSTQEYTNQGQGDSDRFGLGMSNTGLKGFMTNMALNIFESSIGRWGTYLRSATTSIKAYWEYNGTVWKFVTFGAGTKVQISPNNSAVVTATEKGLGIYQEIPEYGTHQVGGSHKLQAIANPAAPTVTNVGTAGTTAYSYYIVAEDRRGGLTLASPAGSTTTGNAVLDVNNYNTIKWNVPPGSGKIHVLKGDTGTLLATVSNTTTSFNDTGQATSAFTAPTRNATADSFIDGRLTANQLAVGNSVAATTTGTVTKKIEVFDASGASLGFVPVYDSIS